MPEFNQPTDSLLELAGFLEDAAALAFKHDPGNAAALAQAAALYRCADALHDIRVFLEENPWPGPLPA